LSVVIYNYGKFTYNVLTRRGKWQRTQNEFTNTVVFFFIHTLAQSTSKRTEENEEISGHTVSPAMQVRKKHRKDTTTTQQLVFTSQLLPTNNASH